MSKIRYITMVAFYTALLQMHIQLSTGQCRLRFLKFKIVVKKQNAFIKCINRRFMV